MRSPDSKDFPVSEHHAPESDGRLAWESPTLTEAEYEETAGQAFQLYGPENIIYT